MDTINNNINKYGLICKRNEMNRDSHYFQKYLQIFASMFAV